MVLPQPVTAATVALTLLLLPGVIPALTAPPSANLPISGLTAEVHSDNSVIYYGKGAKEPILIGNDASAVTGGWKAWNLANNGTRGFLPEQAVHVHGRTKVVGVLYDVGDRDIVISIAATDSVIRVFDAHQATELPSNRKVMLGDWSALCPWRSPKSGTRFFYLFGKKQAVQFIVREKNNAIDVLEVQTFGIPVEPNSCAISPDDSTVYFAADDDKSIYSFKAEDSTSAPKVDMVGKVEDDINGLAVYVAVSSIHFLIVSANTIGVYSPRLELQGSLKLTGFEELEAKGLSIYQSKHANYPAGLVGFALKSSAGQSFGVSSLESAFAALVLEPNTKYDPRAPGFPHKENKKNGFGNTDGSLSCFAGFTGKDCSQFTCKNTCSGRGQCVGPNVCKCKDSWSGPDCSFLLVNPKSETEANGGDGDDPAIWISKSSPDKSRVITTIKSTEGAGLSVFDLNGKHLQHMKAGNPNNVDIIYRFKAGNREIDLAYAACRKDNTLCLFEITPDGRLAEIPGGKQPTEPDYGVYGSCAYRSRTTGKQYLFVNSKKAKYLQYELTTSPNGTLSTTLVRSFRGGSGTQVEGCVADDDNGHIFIGEEAAGVWRYDAEPDGSNVGTVVARVGDGTLFADVEGLAIVPGKNPSQGFLIVSCQGVSALSVFRRAAPHEHVLTFTVGPSGDRLVDGVTNSDGVAVVGTRLSDEFPHGLLVVHDDANELPASLGGGTGVLASFKLVSLKDVLGNKALEDCGLWGLLDEVDERWGLDRAPRRGCRRG
ncbi:uncharacterized protein PADG_08223 [Paracoccidioides brasiliensis Pb18]|uniref:3-phytase n=1 Tax=Paracoccidioides brasiliensis (strain Pb18) TaxID=502780 RepID=C1GMD7_PARBD|nr:uncharacterized protein PADG_08223 [Paracoccidioides brasiliensis Pb18]EEH43603.1 hypothetical protein PADG_08223 [Paracoccidioides brasiliensis Pb18]